MTVLCMHACLMVMDALSLAADSKLPRTHACKSSSRALEEPELNAHPVRLCVMHSTPIQLIVSPVSLSMLLAVAANIMLRSN